MNQTLNFGLPAPIDIQVIGRDKAANQRIAGELRARINEVPGVVDAFIYQAFDQPQLRARHRPGARPAGRACRSATSPTTCW